MATMFLKSEKGSSAAWPSLNLKHREWGKWIVNCFVSTAAQLGIKSFNTVEAKIADCAQSGILPLFLSKVVNFLPRNSSHTLFHPASNNRKKWHF